VADTREIIIQVAAEAAKVYAAASAEEREKIDLLLSLRLSQVTEPADSLEQIMRETSLSRRLRSLPHDLEYRGDKSLAP
jgi:hypothetical protein